MDDKKRKYARFLLTRCLSMNSGEPLLLSYLTEQKEFVRIVKEEAKKLGITEIHDVEYDGEKTRDILMNSTIEEIEKEPYFDRTVIKEVYDKGGSYLSLSSFNKNLLGDVPIEKKNAMNKVKIKTQKDAIKARGVYKFPWCIAAVATKPWADELFPNEENNLEKLWELILKCNLMDKEDPLKAQEEKIKRNTKTKNFLNELKLKKLIYKNNLGTNLELELPDNANWLGTIKTTFDGKKEIIVNAPTNEVFVAPDKDKVNGVVVTSKPVVISGKIIDEIKLTFKDGKVIKIEASNEQTFLENIINNTKNLNRLGECALVNNSSEIAKIDVLFKQILVDENRSCHIALGNAYPKNIINGENMTEEELNKAGLNVCSNHIDLMIGTDDLNIIGTDIYGNEVPIFVDGDFAEEKVIEFIKNRRVA